jgi:hypothetical protein
LNTKQAQSTNRNSNNETIQKQTTNKTQHKLNPLTQTAANALRRWNQLVREHGHGEEVHGLLGLHGDYLEHVQSLGVEGGDLVVNIYKTT